MSDKSRDANGEIDGLQIEKLRVEGERCVKKRVVAGSKTE